MNNNRDNNTRNLKEKILHGALKSLETFSINKLNDIIRKSEEEKTEYGMIFCSDTDKPPFESITYSDLCKGNECSVDLSDCKGRKQIGTFHTHPHVKIGKDFGNLSGTDIYVAIINRRSFSCIGLTEDNRPTIKCFTPQFDIDPNIASDAIKAEDDYGEKLSKVTKGKPNVDTKSVDTLIESYDKRKITKYKLEQESEVLSKKLLSRRADLMIRRQA